MEPVKDRGLAVLVVDDDPSARDVLAEFLGEEGFRVGVEANGEAALAALDRGGYDIVLTDLRMPGMGGLEVLRRVKEKRPDAEVIVLTGYATIQDGVEAMRDGAFDFLLKPIRIDRIEGVMHRCAQWIHHRRSHAELEAVNRKLLDLARMKERFLAVTDHELRTPVAALDGMLHLLARQGAELPDRFRSRLDTLCQVSRRLVHLVRDIHDLVQSRHHAFPIQPDRATVATLLRGIEVDFEMVRSLRRLDLALEVGCPPETEVWADGHRLRQAASELVQNAVKATPDGGRVGVTVARRQGADGARLTVAVADTGLGIPPDERARIFDLCYGMGPERHHHTSKFEYMGSGLGIGLSIALEIARAHGGGVELASEPGVGSTFTLWVPMG